MVIEKDWKLFRKKLPGWQEAYMEKLVKEYAEILSDSSKLASDKFWALEKRIYHDKKDTGVICEMRRSCLEMNLVSLVREGAITMDDLEEFSDEIKETVAYWLK